MKFTLKLFNRHRSFFEVAACVRQPTVLLVRFAAHHKRDLMLHMVASRMLCQLLVAQATQAALLLVHLPIPVSAKFGGQFPFGLSPDGLAPRYLTVCATLNGTVVMFNRLVYTFDHTAPAAPNRAIPNLAEPRQTLPEKLVVTLALPHRAMPHLALPYLAAPYRALPL